MTAISLKCWSEADQKAIREQLVCILNSGPFHQSQRRQRFLEYLVNETLAECLNRGLLMRFKSRGVRAVRKDAAFTNGAWPS